jgi:hypothetical protein
MARAKVWNGSAWVDKTPGAKYWNGSSWVSGKPIKFWDGAQWVTIASATSYPTVFGTPTTASSTNGGVLSPGFPSGYTWQANDFGLFFVMPCLTVLRALLERVSTKQLIQLLL